MIMLQRSIVGIALVSLHAACGGATTTPTPDVVPTQTRVAEQTQVAVALAPTATVAATSTTASTATPIPATATATPPVATATPRPPISIPPPPPVTLPKVGETAQGKGYTLQVHTVVDPPPAGQYSKPKEGFRWIAFDVTVTNTGTAPLDYNLFYFKVKAADNRVIQRDDRQQHTPPRIGQAAARGGSTRLGHGGSTSRCDNDDTGL